MIRSPAARYGALLVVLVVASELQFRHRDPSLALEGDADAQILAQLAVWGAAGLWVAWRGLRDARPFIRSLPHGLGPAMKAMAVIALMNLAWGAYAGSPLSIARAVQFAIMVAVVAMIHGDVVAGRLSTEDLWRMFRRGIWLLVLAAVLLTLAFPELSPRARAYPGIERYRWFATHPIPTGSLLGLALFFLVSSLAGLRDHWLERRTWWLLGRWTLLPVFGWFLLDTKARGPLFAFTLAVVLMIVLSPDARARGGGVLLGLLTLVVLVGTVLGDELLELVLRGQTEAQFLSLTGRDSLFSYGWQLFMDSPMVGYGYLAARSVFLERFPWAGASHNAYLELALSSGLIGVVAYLYAVLRTVQGFGAALARRAEQLAYAREGMAVLAALLLLGFVREGFAGPVGTEPMLFLLLALLSDHARSQGLGTAEGARSGGARISGGAGDSRSGP